MIKTVLLPLSYGNKRLSGIFDKLGDGGFIPLVACHVPTNDGPGMIFSVLGQVEQKDGGAAEAEVPAGGETTEEPATPPSTAGELPSPDVIEADGSAPM